MVTVRAEEMKNKSLADVTGTKTLLKLGGIVVVLALIIVPIAYFALSASENETTGLEIVDIKIKEPVPTLISDRSVSIDPGESVTFNLTVQNNGENITYGNAYSVGIAVITRDGSKYWQLPPEQYIGIDLGPGGMSRHTFVATNRQDIPFRGTFELQGYIKSWVTDEEIARSDIITIEIKSPV